MGIGQSVLRASEQRLEGVARNLANVSTPGYKREVGFSEALARSSRQAGPATTSAPSESHYTEYAQGSFLRTGNPTDFALAGEGFFAVRSADGLLYTRQGQFERAADGRLMNAQGYALQDARGGDVIVHDADFSVEADGTIIELGRPTGQVGVFLPNDFNNMRAIAGTMFRMADGDAQAVANPALRQGETERANVSMADETLQMMSAVRQAETGSKIVQLYDNLMAQVISTFGRSG